MGHQQGSAFAVFGTLPHERITTIPAGFGADIPLFPRSGPEAGFGFLTHRCDSKATVAKLNGFNPPTFVKQIPVSRVGTSHFSFNEDFSKG